MSDLTPMRIRGKRKAIPEEKWHYGKKRKIVKSSTPGADSESSSSKPSSKKRKRRAPELSRLEQLPTEILQSIFVVSANVDLPLASTHLTAQLSNPHLYHDLSDAIYDRACTLPRAEKLVAQHRLMNSKFFTWRYFKEWLLHRFHEAKKRGEYADVDANVVSTWESTIFPVPKARASRPVADIDVLPPIKLLNAPVTGDNINFLEYLTDTRPDSLQNDGKAAMDYDGFWWRIEHPPEVPSWYSDGIKHGVQTAISAGNAQMLFSCWMLGLQPHTEHLQQAVIDAGCNKLVVYELLRRNGNPPLDATSPRISHINVLDQMVWSWAEKADERGDDKAKWLCDTLRHFSRQPHDPRKTWQGYYDAESFFEWAGEGDHFFKYGNHT